MCLLHLIKRQNSKALLQDFDIIFARVIISKKGGLDLVRKFVVFFLVLGLITSLFCLGQAEAEKKVIELWIGKKEVLVNGTVDTIDVAPFQENGRTMVPLRFITGCIAARVSWINSEQKVIVENENTIISMWIGKQVAYVNQEEINLDVAPMLVDGHTFVPLRFICENVGGEATWDEKEQKITITFGGERTSWNYPDYLLREAISMSQTLKSFENWSSWLHSHYMQKLGPHDSVILETPYTAVIGMGMAVRLHQQSFTLSDARLISDMTDISFSVQVFGNNSDFCSKYSAAVILEDGLELQPYLLTVPSEGTFTPAGLGKPKFFAICSWSFEKSRIPPNQRVTFVIRDPQKGEERAEFDLKNYK